MNASSQRETCPSGTGETRTETSQPFSRRQFFILSGAISAAFTLPNTSVNARPVNPASSTALEAERNTMDLNALPKPNIVLVHGAFADGSSWSRVIPLLVNAGYNVIAVQNPLTSVADDIATTRRVIDAQTGPTVVVGHSYGGCIITQAAKNAPNVKALVYVAAMAPDEGETNGGQAAQYPPTLLGKHIKPDAAGFAYVDRASFREVFCADVDKDQAAVMAAAQKPIAGPTFADLCRPVAWKDVPVFFAISENDNAIHTEQQKAEAKRMNATILSLKSSHASMVSHPKEIAALIEKAAAV